MQHSPQDGFPYYHELAKSADCLSLFSSEPTLTFLNSLDEERATYRYAPDKWSIKQVIGHITDHERIMMSRAFLLSRNELVELWNYDQNALVENSRFEALTWVDLVIDFHNVRKASFSFIKGLSENQLKIKGMARQHQVSLEAFLKSIIGHEMHHINIIKERY